jgi:hypothetical protein
MSLVFTDKKPLVAPKKGPLWLCKYDFDKCSDPLLELDEFSHVELTVDRSLPDFEYARTFIVFAANHMVTSSQYDGGGHTLEDS